MQFTLESYLVLDYPNLNRVNLNSPIFYVELKVNNYLNRHRRLAFAVDTAAAAAVIAVASCEAYCSAVVAAIAFVPAAAVDLPRSTGYCEHSAGRSSFAASVIGNLANLTGGIRLVS